MDIREFFRSRFKSLSVPLFMRELLAALPFNMVKDFGGQNRFQVANRFAEWNKISTNIFKVRGDIVTLDEFKKKLFFLYFAIESSFSFILIFNYLYTEILKLI